MVTVMIVLLTLAFLVAVAWIATSPMRGATELDKWRKANER